MMTTKSFARETPTGRVGVRTLDDGTRVKEIADACRSAGLAFAWSASLWGKRELAQWLVGPYARAAVSTPTMTRAVTRSVTSTDGDEGSPITADAIAALLESVHVRLLDSLGRTWTWRTDSDFVRSMIDQGMVVGVVDDDGAFGYAPVDAPNMRLVDRARSLFLADWLTRPEDYATFGVCTACGAATFDDGASHRDDCAGDALTVRARRSTLRLTQRGLGERRASAAPAPAVVLPRATPLPTFEEIALPFAPRLVVARPVLELLGDGDFEVDIVFTDGPEIDPELEILGEDEIAIDASELCADAVDDFGDIRDTLLDPMEMAACF